ncbi:MAG TPA: MmcQ/YjbR family DNA-binding protein [Terriglobales bacterium]|nr:MmcQ/YjbR family DNA-binding protein [Terriglobales bacterium]
MNIDWLREHCLSLTHATETMQWGDNLVFKVGGKMFAVVSLEPSARTHLSCKCTAERFAELTEIPGIIPAPYMARAMWVAFEDLNALRADEIRALISESYGLVFAKLTKKMQQELTAVGTKRKASTSKARRSKRRS